LQKNKNLQNSFFIPIFAPENQNIAFMNAYFFISFSSDCIYFLGKNDLPKRGSC
jgi:hypothetical protein